MQSSKTMSSSVIGLALFSMFFGSGNLIYPLFIGQAAQSFWPLAALGFFLTAVALPFMGVIAMLLFQGNFERFFSSLGKNNGFYLSLLLLTVWIPLGSGPRCIVLSYQSLASYFEMPSLALFSFFYSLLVFLIIRKKKQILHILGYFLTPALLLCLFVIIIKGILKGKAALMPDLHDNFFLLGIREGYNTMDLIASFFFSASIIRNVETLERGESLKKILRACLFASFLLAAVYLGLIFISALHAEALKEIPKEQLLAFVSKKLLGAQNGIIAAVAVVLACLTTSIAMLSVYSEFLQEKLYAKQKVCIFFSLLLTFWMSIFGLEGISAVTSPVLSICYPFLILMIAYNLIKELVYLEEATLISSKD